MIAIWDSTRLDYITNIVQPFPESFVSQPGSEKKGETLFVPEGKIVSYLIVEKCTASERIGQRLEIVDYPFFLGRETPILLNESEVSRRHAEFTFDPRTKKFYITDLHSTNGVAINTKIIQPDLPHEIGPGGISNWGQALLCVLKFKTAHFYRVCNRLAFGVTLFLDNPEYVTNTGSQSACVSLNPLLYYKV